MDKIRNITAALLFATASPAALAWDYGYGVEPLPHAHSSTSPAQDYGMGYGHARQVPIYQIPLLPQPSRSHESYELYESRAHVKMLERENRMLEQENQALRARPQILYRDTPFGNMQRILGCCYGRPGEREAWQ